MITAQRVWKAAVKHASRAAIRAKTLLGAPKNRNCPACGASVAGFFRYGENPEWGCPDCLASPRERLMAYLLDSGRITVPGDATLLHCAPTEANLIRRYSQAAAHYVPADIDPDRYDVPGVQRVDLMALTDEAKFDRIYASHVMEHVPDDALVLSNIARALKPGGEAWLIVPLWDHPTEDGAGDMSGREREQRFGQWDHVRQYGLDFADRIRAAGLAVEIIAAKDLPPESRDRMALDDILFRAVR